MNVEDRREICGEWAVVSKLSRGSNLSRGTEIRRGIFEFEKWKERLWVCPTERKVEGGTDDDDDEVSEVLDVQYFWENVLAF